MPKLQDGLTHPFRQVEQKLDLSDIREEVIHLVYRPKPWDPLGLLHGQYDYFHSILQRTAISKLPSNRGQTRGTYYD